MWSAGLILVSILCTMIHMETWKRIESFPAYSASTEGRIRRDLAGQGTRTGVLQPYAVGAYPGVGVWKDGKRTTRTVHSLVAEAFHGKRPKGAVVHHKDHDKLNSRPDNLVYVTRSRNTASAFDAGFAASKRGEDHAKAILTDESATSLREDYAEGMSQRAAAKKYGVTRTTVAALVAGRTWTHLFDGPVKRRRISKYAPFQEQDKVEG